jgi:hypothetical protein
VDKKYMTFASRCEEVDGYHWEDQDGIELKKMDKERCILKGEKKNGRRK